MHYRNLSILVLCQLISATGSIVIVTLGGIIGTSLSPNAAFATVPVSIMVVGTASMTIPAALLMKRIGRKAGFAMSSLSAGTAMLLAAWSLWQSSFAWFIVAAGLLGINLAFTQQYRYAAAESVEPRFAGRAISFVLVGAIGGAFLGPELVAYGEFRVQGVPFAGTLIAVASLYVVQFVLFLALGPMRSESASEQRKEIRPLSRIVRQPVFVVAVLSGTAAYGVMTFIMTATPISMHVNDGFSIADTARVIRSHVLGMYVPSLVSGFLLDRYGTVKIMIIGVVALIVASLIGFHDRSYLHYTAALIILGVGWNFLYVGATTTLTLTYSMAERFKAQAMNEFCVFGTAAVASLMAGTMIHFFGWKTLVLAPIPILLLILVALYIVRNNSLLHSSRT